MSHTYAYYRLHSAPRVLRSHIVRKNACDVLLVSPWSFKWSQLQYSIDFFKSNIYWQSVHCALLVRCFTCTKIYCACGFSFILCYFTTLPLFGHFSILNHLTHVSCKYLMVLKFVIEYRCDTVSYIVYIYIIRFCEIITHVLKMYSKNYCETCLERQLPWETTCLHRPHSCTVCAPRRP